MNVESKCLDTQRLKPKKASEKKETFSLNLDSQLCIKISKSDLNLLKKASQIKRISLNGFVRSSSIEDALKLVNNSEDF